MHITAKQQLPVGISCLPSTVLGYTVCLGLLPGVGALISGAAASGATKPFTPVRYEALAVAPGPACRTPDAV